MAAGRTRSRARRFTRRQGFTDTGSSTDWLEGYRAAEAEVEQQAERAEGPKA